MEIKVYLNKNFPMSMSNPIVEITKDLEYVGEVFIDGYFVIDVLEQVFRKLQLQEDLGIARSLSVGDVLSVRLSEDECTRFYLIDDVGFKKL